MVATQLTELPVGVDVPGLQQEVERLKQKIGQMERDSKADIKTAEDRGWSNGFWFANMAWIGIAIAAFILIYQPWTWTT